LIELWETYLLQLDSDEDGPPLMPAGVHADAVTAAAAKAGEQDGEDAEGAANGEEHEREGSLSGTTVLGGEEHAASEHQDGDEDGEDRHGDQVEDEEHAV
ncbi:Vacuolar protein sorting-associated protein vps5, partial [Oleoguttula sp. CCFEE 5521]